MTGTRGLMMRQLTLLSALWITATAAAASFDLPKPVPLPTWDPPVPQGEKTLFPGDFAGAPGAPNLGAVAALQRHLALRHHAICRRWRRHVCLARAQGQAGFSLLDGYRRTGGEAGRQSRWQRLHRLQGRSSLWIKGDGSDRNAIISTNWQGSDHRYEIPLKETNWHKVFIAWEDFKPKPITGPWWYVNFGIDHDRCLKAHLVHRRPCAPLERKGDRTDHAHARYRPAGHAARAGPLSSAASSSPRRSPSSKPNSPAKSSLPAIRW